MNLHLKLVIHKKSVIAKGAARVDALKPAVANAMLGYELESEEDADEETVGELDNAEEETEEEE